MSSCPVWTVEIDDIFVESEAQFLLSPVMSATAQRSITLHGWTIRTTKLPILNAQETDSQVLPSFPFSPLLTLSPYKQRHRRPPSSSSRNLLRKQPSPHRKRLGSAFLRLECPRCSPRCKATQWTQSRPRCRMGSRVRPLLISPLVAQLIRYDSQAASSSSAVSVQKPFDWTYTTLHPGHISLPIASTSQLPAFEPAPKNHPGIPLHKLARMDVPIVFYDEAPLYEDELGDNGIAELVVRVVRPSFTSQFLELTMRTESQRFILLRPVAVLPQDRSRPLPDIRRTSISRIRFKRDYSRTERSSSIVRSTQSSLSIHFFYRAALTNGIATSDR